MTCCGVKIKMTERSFSSLFHSCNFPIFFILDAKQSSFLLHIIKYLNVIRNEDELGVDSALVVRHVTGRRTEFGVALDHLVDGLEEVLLGGDLASRADGKHAGLGAHGPARFAKAISIRATKKSAARGELTESRRRWSWGRDGRAARSGCPARRTWSARGF